jgi:hypothetical protein
MPIRIQCPSCGKRLSAKDEQAGKKVACPGCKNTLVLPAVLSPPLLESSEPVVTLASVRRRKKQSDVSLYVAIAAAVAALAAVVLIIIHLVSTDRGVAENTDPLPKGDTPPKINQQLNTAASPKPQAKPAPKTELVAEVGKIVPEPKPQANAEIASPDPPAVLEAEPKAGDRLVLKPFPEEKPADAVGSKPAATPDSKPEEAARKPTADSESIEQVLQHLTDLGFSAFADLGETGMIVPGPRGQDYEVNIWTYENRVAGTTLSLTRNLALDVGTHAPGPRYEIRAAHDEKNRKALVELGGKISSSVEKAVQDCLAQYDRTHKGVEKSVGKVKVYVDRTGAYIESNPAVIPGVHFSAVGRVGG